MMLVGLYILCSGFVRFAENSPKRNDPYELRQSMVIAQYLGFFSSSVTKKLNRLLRKEVKVGKEKKRLRMLNWSPSL